MSTSGYEIVYEDSTSLINPQYIERLIVDINNELTKLVEKFGEHDFSNFVPLLVDALTTLHECSNLAQELLLCKKNLNYDLKCLEKQFEKEKTLRQFNESIRLENEFKFEEKINLLESKIEDKNAIISRLSQKIDGFPEQFLDEDDALLGNRRQNSVILRERNELKEENDKLMGQITTLEEELCKLKQVLYSTDELGCKNAVVLRTTEATPVTDKLENFGPNEQGYTV